MDYRGIPPMNFDGNLSETWTLWKQRFTTYLKATENNKKDDGTKVAQLLTLIGEQGIRIYNTFTFTEETDKEKLEPVLSKFDSHFRPKKNVAFERFKFLTCEQKPGQTLDQFITEVQSLSMSCELEQLRDSLVRDIILIGIKNESVRDVCFQGDKLTLDDTISICKTREITQEHNRQISNGNSHQPSHHVDAMHARRPNTYHQQRKPHRQQSARMQSRSQTRSQACSRCGGTHAEGCCPAFGKQCGKCGLIGHFYYFCKTTPNVNSNNSNSQRNRQSSNNINSNHSNFQSNRQFSKRNFKNFNNFNRNNHSFCKFRSKFFK